MDYSAIHHQYLRDLATALDHGAIGIGEFDVAKSALERRHARRTLERELHNSSNRLGYFLRFVLLSNAFRVREKLRMLRRIIRF